MSLKTKIGPIVCMHLGSCCTVAAYGAFVFSLCVALVFAYFHIMILHLTFACYMVVLTGI